VDIQTALAGKPPVAPVYLSYLFVGFTLPDHPAGVNALALEVVAVGQLR